MRFNGFRPPLWLLPRKVVCSQHLMQTREAVLPDNIGPSLLLGGAPLDMSRTTKGLQTL